MNQVKLYQLARSSLQSGLLFRSRTPISASFCSSVQAKSTKPAAADPHDATADLNKSTHHPNAFERKLLVWTGRYKNVDEVPAMINHDVMQKCQSQFRIKVSNYMMILTAIGCIVMVYSGKKAAERGDSVQKQNMEWHKQYNEEQMKKEGAPAAAPTH